MIGVVVHPIVFTFIWFEFIFDSNIYLSAIIYAVLFGIMMFMMLGFLGAPSEWRMKMGMGIIMGHVIYGLSLALFADQAFIG